MVDRALSGGEGADLLRSKNRGLSSGQDDINIPKTRRNLSC